MMNKHVRVGFILSFLVLFLTFAMVVQASEMNFGVGKAGNTYDKVIGGNLAIQLKGSSITFTKTNFAGSDEIVKALENGEIDAAVVQMDALIGKSFPFQIVSKTHEEFAHMLVLDKSDIEEVGDLIGKKIAVGPNGGGTKITWRNWSSLDKKYSEKVSTLPKSGSTALSDLENGNVDAILYIGGLRGSDMMRANKREGSYRLVKINDSQFNNLEVKGEKVYNFTKIDDDVYPNLIGWGSVETLSVSAVIIVSEKWVDENGSDFDTFYDAVTDALPNIKQALAND